MKFKRTLLVLLLLPVLWSSSVWSNALPPVAGVEFDGEFIRWEPVPGAIGYNVYIDDFTYIDTVIGKSEYQPFIDALYYVAAFDNSGNYSPLEVITDNSQPLSNNVRIGTGGIFGEELDDFFTDSDADGFSDLFDNCPFIENPEQLDTDNDFIGDACDSSADSESDGADTLADLPVGPVANVTFNGETITWDELSGAIGYNIHLEGEYLDTVNNLPGYIPPVAGRYTIIGFDGMGNYSPREIIFANSVPLTNRVEVVFGGSTAGDVNAVDGPQLDAVTNVSFNGELITWDAVAGAIGYNIYTSGFDYLDTVSSLTEYRPLFNETYYVAAFDNNGSYSPLQVITDDVVPLTNSVEIVIQ